MSSDKSCDCENMNLLLKDKSDAQYSKCVKDLKAFLDEYDDIIERAADLKERLADLFRDLKNKGYDNKALKAVLKERKMRIYDEGYEEFFQARKFYENVFAKLETF